MDKITSSKAIELFQSYFTKVEKREFKYFIHFISGGAFKVSENVIIYCNFLSTNLKNGKLESLSRASIVERFNVKARTIDNWHTEIIKNLEAFILYRKLINGNGNEHSLANKSLLANQYLELGMKTEFEVEFNRVLEGYENFNFGTKKEHLVYHHLFSDHVIFTKLYQEKDRITNESFIETIINLNQFYWVERLKLECEKLNRNRINNEKLELSPIVEQIEADAENLLLHPIIETYYNIYFMLSNRKKENYNNASKNLDKVLELDSDEERSTICEYLLNFCIEMINANIERKTFVLEFLSINDIMLAQNILLSKGVLDIGKYKNIVSVCILSGDFDLANESLEKFQYYLAKKDRDNAYAYNLANILCNKSQFEESYAELLKIKNVRKMDRYYKVGYYKLMIKCLVELNLKERRFESAEKQINTFKRFLVRYKEEGISKGYIEPLTNFFNILLLFFHSDYSRNSSNLLIEKVTDTKKIIDKEWLIKVIRQSSY